MSWAAAFLLCLVTGQALSAPAGPLYGLIQRLVRNNLAGAPENFRTQQWDFDPEVSDRRRTEFEARHGRMGERLVQRFGLGEDGFPELRLQQQLARDAALVAPSTPAASAAHAAPLHDNSVYG
ncbi:uncharacterized protein LOC126272047 [Schistocerca gregaria]|uniref:uncharacterized protein LOC126272047 n=1 Tax=Schistocerca gregaria TaxID=7010 RepID=UPI00211F278D|nr:uncharacterized protein LOC126272047 [Schistocerca gregaria]